jgi:hypothetical protein
MKNSLLVVGVLSTIVGLGSAQGADESPLATPKGSIAHQFELLKASKVEDLKACFTARQKERITPELVKKAQATAGKMTLEELVAEVTEGEFEGKKTAKIKMKNGRTLTTLILTDGKWLADTIWFQ